MHRIYNYKKYLLGSKLPNDKSCINGPSDWGFYVYNIIYLADTGLWTCLFVCLAHNDNYIVAI